MSIIRINSCYGPLYWRLSFDTYVFHSSPLTNFDESQYILLLHWLYRPLGPRPLFFSFMIILQRVGLLGRVISSSQGLYVNTGQHKHRINTYTHQTFMPCVGYEPTIPASEREKTARLLWLANLAIWQPYYTSIILPRFQSRSFKNLRKPLLPTSSSFDKFC
jgi:hypothetical protein